MARPPGSRRERRRDGGRTRSGTRGGGPAEGPPGNLGAPRRCRRGARLRRRARHPRRRHRDSGRQAVPGGRDRGYRRGPCLLPGLLLRWLQRPGGPAKAVRHRPGLADPAGSPRPRQPGQPAHLLPQPPPVRPGCRASLRQPAPAAARQWPRGTDLVAEPERRCRHPGIPRAERPVAGQLAPQPARACHRRCRGRRENGRAGTTSGPAQSGRGHAVAGRHRPPRGAPNHRLLCCRGRTRRRLAGGPAAHQPRRLAGRCRQRARAHAGDRPSRRGRRSDRRDRLDARPRRTRRADQHRAPAGRNSAIPAPPGMADPALVRAAGPAPPRPAPRRPPAPPDPPRAEPASPSPPPPSLPCSSTTPRSTTTPSGPDPTPERPIPAKRESTRFFSLSPSS